MRDLSSAPRSPTLAALIVFIAVAVSLLAVTQTEGALNSRNSGGIKKAGNVDGNSNRNEMDGFDDAEGDGYGYDDDDYDHSHTKRNDDKNDADKTDKLKDLGSKIDKQESKNTDGNTALVGGGKQDKAKLNDDKSNVAVEEGKPKADVQSDEEKPNNKNDKVRINDGEVKKQAKTFADTQKVEEKNKDSANVKSDKNPKVIEENKISSSGAEKNSAVEKSSAEAKEIPKDEKAGYDRDRKNSENLNKKAELKGETNDVRENRQNEKEDAADASRLNKLRPSEQEKTDSENSGTAKITGSRREEMLQEEEKESFKGESSKKSGCDADSKIDDEEEETMQVGGDPEELQASNREYYNSLASDDLSNEIDDVRDNNSEDSLQLNIPIVKLEDTDYHKNFVKSLNRFKNKKYAIKDEQDLDRSILQNLANQHEDFNGGRRRTRSRQMTRSKTGNPHSYDPNEVSRLRSKFLDALREQEADDANGEPRNRKRKSPKTLEFKIQIIDQNEGKTKASLARSLRQKKRIRFGQGSDRGYPEKSKSFHVGRKRLTPEFETVGGKGKRDEDIVYAPPKISYEEAEEPKALVLVKKKQNGEKLTKTFVDGSSVKCLEDDLSSDDLAKMLAQKKEYVVLKKVPTKSNEYKVYGESEAEDKVRAKETERNEEMARPERKQKIKYVSLDENDLGNSEETEAAQIRTKGFKSVEKKPKILEEPSGLGDLFKEEEEKKMERPANEDSRYPPNDNDSEKEIIYLDEKAEPAKAKATKEEESSKLSSEEKDFRAAVIKQSEMNREKAQRLQEKNQGKEVIIYNGGYGSKRPFTDYKFPEKIASYNVRYRGPKYNGKYPQKYVVFNDNLEPKHQLKIIKNDGIIPDDRIIEMDRRIQSQKNHHQGQGNKILDRPSLKNRFVDKETGAVYAVVKPSGARKESLADASSKGTSKRNSKTGDFLSGNEISGNFQRFLKDFQELTEAGSEIHRQRARASDGPAVSGDQIRELKSYGDASLRNLNELLEDLITNRNEGLNPDEASRRESKQKENIRGKLYKSYDKILEDASPVKGASKEDRASSKVNVNEPSESERRDSSDLYLKTDPDETDENELNENTEDSRMEKEIKKRQDSSGIGKKAASNVAPAENEENVIENQIQQILKNYKNNKNNEGKTRKKRESDEGETRDTFGTTRKLLSLEKTIDPAILQLFGKAGTRSGKREESRFNSFIRKREIDIDESVPNRLNDLLETSFDGTGNEKREVVKKDQPVWESNNNNEEASDQIVEDDSRRNGDSESVLEKRDAFDENPQEEHVSLESDKVNFYDSDMMPSNEWKRGNDRLFGGREKIARNTKLKRSQDASYYLPERSQRESSNSRGKITKKPLREKNQQFTIDKSTFEDMIKKYLESGQATDSKSQNQVPVKSDVTYHLANIPKPTFQTTIDLTKLDKNHPVKDGHAKILPTENLSPASKGNNVKLSFLDPGRKSNVNENPSYVLQKTGDEKPSKESSLRDLAEIVRRLKDFFEQKKLQEQEDGSSKETDPETGKDKEKFDERYYELSEEGQDKVNEYSGFENDPESEFDQGEDEEEEQAEDFDDETLESQQAESGPQLNENELTDKWSTFSNVYPKDNRKGFKSGNKNGMGWESDKRTYFKDRRKQEILFDQDQDLGSDANTIGFANENPKFFGKKVKSKTNLNRINYDETEEKGKDKKINKWQGFRDEEPLFAAKEKRGFFGKSKTVQGVHRHYPKGDRINNHEVRKVGNTLDTGSMKRNAKSKEETSDDDSDDDVIQNIIGGYILRKSTKIRPEQGLNSVGSSERKSKISDDENFQKYSHFSDESNGFEKAKRTRKRLSPGRMAEAHFRKYHRKNSAHKRGTENFDDEQDEEDSFDENSQYQRNGETKNAEKSRNNIRITITREEEEDGNKGTKENRRKRYGAASKEGIEDGFERVLSDPKSVAAQTWSKSRSAPSPSASAIPDGPLKVDLNEEIPWAYKKAPKPYREETMRNEPEAETYVVLEKKKRSVGPDRSSSLAVSNHLDKLPITNRALPVKHQLLREKTQSFSRDINGGQEHQRKTALAVKNSLDSGNIGKAEDSSCPVSESGAKMTSLSRSEEAYTPSSEESTKKIGEQIIDCIFSRVESNPRFKQALGPGLLCQKREKSNGKEEGTCSVSNKPITKKIRPLLKKLMVDLEKVVEEDEKRRSCVKIDKETSQFLRTMLEKSDSSNVEPFHNQNKFHFDSLLVKPEKQISESSGDTSSSSSSASKNQKPDKDALTQKQILLLKLIDEYQRLSPPEKTKVEPFYTYLQGQLSDGNPVSNPTSDSGKSRGLSQPESIENRKSSTADKKNFKGALTKNRIHSTKIKDGSQTYLKNQESINKNSEREKALQKSKPTSLVLSNPTQGQNRSPGLKKNVRHEGETGFRGNRKWVSKSDRKEKIRPEKELHKLGIGDAAALQLTLGQKPWSSNLDVAKGGKARDFKIRYQRPSQGKSG